MEQDHLPTTHLLPAWRRWLEDLLRRVPMGARRPSAQEDLERGLRDNCLETVTQALAEGGDPTLPSPMKSESERLAFMPPSLTQWAVEKHRYVLALACHAYECARCPDRRKKLAEALGWQCAWAGRVSPTPAGEEAEARQRLILAILPHVDSEARARLYLDAVKDNTPAGHGLLAAMVKEAGGVEEAAGPKGKPFPLWEVFHIRNIGALKTLVAHMPEASFARDWNLEARTMLLFAARRGWNEAVEVLLSMEFKPGQLDDRDMDGGGETALMLFVRNNNMDTAHRLLDAGASAKPADFRRNTVFHHLARMIPEKEQVNVLGAWRKFIDAGGDPYARNEDGLTGDDILRQRGLPGMEEAQAITMATLLDEHAPAACQHPARPRMRM